MVREIVGRTKTGIKAFAGLKFNCFDLIRRDHMKVEKLVIEMRLEKDSEKRRTLLRQLDALLKRHMRIEENVLYAACARFKAIAPLVDHAHTDHQLVKNVLKDLAAMDPGSQGYLMLLNTFIKKAEHHIIEEENVLFAEIRKHFEPDEWQHLNTSIREAYQAEMGVYRKAA